MELDFDACYEAVLSRDARFDGRFFTAVVTTGVYCRPICPARPPRPENVRFFPCAAAAEEAGFRPCKRCQPHRAPGTPLWVGTAAAVSQAMSLVEAGFLDDHSLEDLADRLHLTSRHLRRLFSRHLGTNPVAVAQTRRLHFARTLLQETPLSVLETAMAAGFGSLRRFNECFRRTFGQSPTQLRERVTRHFPRAWELEFTLAYRPPLDWEGILGFLAARAIPGVETVDDGEYRRTTGTPEKPGHLGVSRAPSGLPSAGRAIHGAARGSVIHGGHALRLRMCGVEAPRLAVTVNRIRRLFDLGAAPDVIAARLSGSAALADRLARRPGLRVPGAWSGFELAVRAILGQQVSVAGATTLAGKLVRAFGTPLAAPPCPGLTHLFPTPIQVAAGDPKSFGLPRARAEALRGLARAVADGRLDLEGTRDPTAVRVAMRGLPGLGDWTVEYVAMRALADPDAFPASDLGIRKALGGSGMPITAVAARRCAEAWRPWRAYGAMLLWLEPRA